MSVDLEYDSRFDLIKGIDHFEDIGPCVIMASPGMMQSGLSRELFESWCTDPKNGVIIAGYCVEGTLAKTILSEPEEITSMSGQKLPLKMSVDYISFSAHTDYQQTSEFINILKPPHVVLVHGEQNEMSRLKAALQREHRGKLAIHTPRNTQQLCLTFRGDKTAKVMGSLAMEQPEPGKNLQGILVKRNFNYHILAPSDLNSKYFLLLFRGSDSVNILVHEMECVIEMLQEMFGEDSVPKMFKGDKLHVEVDGKRAYIDLLAMVYIYKL
ncbi:jg9659 [Pararge aegeria aegeria]|uniref:Jg9659 protein n=1 Tax=Pararge aegeria aegeria TaxID=348720 RepID=A0A8S4RZA2_9NEOP|nr:jg9659 [Pararge aegeria aegeria]